jgi:hypothetical protein
MRALLCVLLLIALCVPLHASQNDWRWYFCDRTQCGVLDSAKDGADVNDLKAGPLPGTVPIYAVTFHERGVDGWDGDTGVYWGDFRSPLTTVGQTKTWRLYVATFDAGSSTSMAFTWGSYSFHPPAFDKIEYTLTYVQSAVGGDGPTFPVGTTVALNDQQQGTWVFPVYETADPRNGYVIDFTATVIPEPSSLLALLAGLAGFGAMIRRRR